MQIIQVIQQYRAALDAANPPENGWNNVVKALDRWPQADGLEQFLLLNRPLLDLDEPPAGLWNRIDNTLGQNASDTLEQFIRQHREALDTGTPDLRVWAEVEKSLPGNNGKVLRVHWQRNILRAAAAITLLVTGIGLGFWYGRADQQAIALAEISPEYGEIEQYYQRDIAAKQQKLATFASNRDSDVHLDLQQLDGILLELRQELAHVPPGNREQVVRAMLENYKAKASILQRVLERLEQQQQEMSNSEGHEIEKI